MKDLKLYLILIACCLSSVVCMAADETVVFSLQGYRDLAQPGYVMGEGMRIDFPSKGTSATYYNSDKTLHVYKGGSIVVSSTCGRDITGISFSFYNTSSTPVASSMSVDNGVYDAGSKSWSGTARSVSFSHVGTKGVWYLKSIAVTYAAREVLPESVTLGVGPTGYATLYYSSFALVVPDGMEAYTYTLGAGGLSVSRTYSAGEVIPADEAVVVRAAEGSYVLHVREGLFARDAGNMLYGTDTDTQLVDHAGSYFYKLSLNSDGDPGSVGFYWGSSTGGAFVNGAHKAYLRRDAAPQARRAYPFREATGVVVPPKMGSSTGRMYNTAGQQVDSRYKGLIIQHGRKVVVR